MMTQIYANKISRYILYNTHGMHIYIHVILCTHSIIYLSRGGIDCGSEEVHHKSHEEGDSKHHRCPRTLPLLSTLHAWSTHAHTYVHVHVCICMHAVK